MEMDIIRQTGKTIIFEEFNKEKKLDLVSLLTKDMEAPSLEKFTNALMDKGESGLAVESFDEFIEKFAPTIYEQIVKVEENSIKFVYTLEKPSKYDYTEIQLKDHAFYKMILSLLDRKANTDKGNMEFPYEDLKKALTPKAEMEACMRIRKNYFINCEEYSKLKDNGASERELSNCAKNIINCRREIISKYQNESPLGFLPVAIADTQNQLDMLNKASEGIRENHNTQTIICTPSFDNDGNLYFIDSIYDDTKEIPEINENMQISDVLKRDYIEYAPASIQENEYFCNLIVNIFVPTVKTQLTTSNRVELEARKKQYQDVYRNSLESFAKVVSEVVEKFAGVKSFFDHAVCKGNLAQDVSVIVANCKINSILNNEIAKKRFKKYFNDLGNEKGVNKIWFGIIPSVAEEEGKKIEEEINVDPFSDLELTTTVKQNDTDWVTLSEVKEMLSLLKEAKIMTFVSYKSSEETGFVSLTSKKVEDYKKNFKSIDSEYAVFVYPNFTILPSEKSIIKIGTEYDEMEGEKNVNLTIPGIYLDACYVAAGMMVGIQDYKFLKEKGYFVKPQYPCVRFDIEDEENAKKIPTKLNRETITDMSRETKDEIMLDRFGFVFADNRIVYNGKIINNSYVLNARTLKKGKNGIYKSLYKTLVKNLVYQLLYSEGDTIEEKVVNKFLQDYVKEWKADNKDAEKQYANRILQKGESIDLISRKIQITFNKEAEILDNIEIEDMEGGN